MNIPLQMACSKKLEVTTQFKELSGPYQNKAGKPALSRRKCQRQGEAEFQIQSETGR